MNVHGELLVREAVGSGAGVLAVAAGDVEVDSTKDVLLSARKSQLI